MILNIEVRLGFCVYSFLVFFVKVSSSALKKNFLESKWREYTIGNRSFQYTSIQPQTLYCHYLLEVKANQSVFNIRLIFTRVTELQTPSRN